MQKKAARLPAVLLLTVAILASGGCGAMEHTELDSEEKINIVLTTGFQKNEVFRLEDASCTRAELMVYLATEQNRYEKVYGTDIWESLEGAQLEERIKEKVLAEISQIKAMTLLAARRGITLEEKEQEQAARAAEQYYSSLNETEKDTLGVTQQLIEEMYQDYALADKVYRAIISDINPEISDDEARTITVQHILIRTTTENADGTRTPYSEEEKEKCYQRALQIHREAVDGEAFEALIEKYNEDTQGVLSFGKGEQEEAFENAAFNLGNGEISPVVETAEGYEIIKCISTFNREETDRNKQKIVEKRRDEVFGQEYDAFVDSLARNLNEQLWESVTLVRDPEVTTDSFFEVYTEYFE